MSTYQEGKVYDIIFAGGGTAACAAAGRLARRDPGLSILIIEQGRNNHQDPSIVYPALYLSHLGPDAKTTLFYKGNKEQAVNGRQVTIAAGGVLGGGSSINFMMYSRGE
jgi:alcohol oxidase